MMDCCYLSCPTRARSLPSSKLKEGPDGQAQYDNASKVVASSVTFDGLMVKVCA
jgi:hypothetical protein